MTLFKISNGFCSADADVSEVIVASRVDHRYPSSTALLKQLFYERKRFHACTPSTETPLPPS